MTRNRLHDSLGRLAALTVALVALISRFGLPPGAAAMLIASGLAGIVALPVTAVLASEMRRRRAA